MVDKTDDDGRLKDQCGVVGLYSHDKKDVSPYMFYALFSLQHRGQESCGMTTRDEKFHTEKDMGLVPEVFDLDKLEKLQGYMGIGHVRYSTTGESKLENAQPFVVAHSKCTMAIGHNGNIINSFELRKKLEASGQAFVSTTDTEVIAQLIIREFLKNNDIVASIAEVMKTLVGSYSLTILTDNTLIGVRDPLGIRPLCLGRVDDTYILASESVALDAISAEYIKDIAPGEIVVIDDRGVKSYKPFKLNRKAHCMFEYVYFARPDSALNKVQVYNVRERIGQILGESDGIEADFVTAIPDSAIPFALGYSRSSGIPYREGLIKNRYVGRTFILPSQKARELAVRFKLNPMSSEVKGKRIVLFDDSIVRGTTSSRVIGILKASGAKEVHMRVGCPPIKSPCQLGIDMPTPEELIASDKSVEEIRRYIGADSLRYSSIEELEEAIGMDEDELCLGCLTGDYPVDMSKYEQVLLSSFISR
ncbi:MAG: amidophosphoribosyltransferase [Candidatus Hydrothermarchaeales archaeon]